MDQRQLAADGWKVVREHRKLLASDVTSFVAESSGGGMRRYRLWLHPSSGLYAISDVGTKVLAIGLDLGGAVAFLRDHIVSTMDPAGRFGTHVKLVHLARSGVVFDPKVSPAALAARLEAGHIETAIAAAPTGLQAAAAPAASHAPAQLLEDQPASAGLSIVLVAVVGLAVVLLRR